MFLLQILLHRFNGCHLFDICKETEKSHTLSFEDFPFFFTFESVIANEIESTFSFRNTVVPANNFDDVIKSWKTFFKLLNY